MKESMSNFLGVMMLLDFPQKALILQRYRLNHLQMKRQDVWGLPQNSLEGREGGRVISEAGLAVC